MSEVRRMMHEEDSPFRTHIFEMGLRPLEIECFFEMMTAAGSGDEVEFAHFVHGVTKMRGQATSIDLQHLAFQVKIMHRQIDAIASTLEESRPAPITRSGTRSKDALKNTKDDRQIRLRDRFH